MWESQGVTCFFLWIQKDYFQLGHPCQERRVGANKASLKAASLNIEFPSYQSTAILPGQVQLWGVQSQPLHGEATQIWRHACDLSAHCLTSNVIGLRGREATVDRGGQEPLKPYSLAPWCLILSPCGICPSPPWSDSWGQSYCRNAGRGIFLEIDLTINYFPVQTMTNNCFKMVHPIYVYLQGDYRYQTLERERLTAFVHEALVVQFSLEA